MKIFGIKIQVWFKRNEFNICDIDGIGKYGNTAIMQAAREGNIEIIKELLQLEANLNILNEAGNNALWNACVSDCKECVEALIEAGIDLNTQNINGTTPLMYCACTGKEYFVELLIQKGANTQLLDLDGFKAIDLAVTPKIIAMLKNANLS
ncbi:MAG: ankyrin repeat domain-containing protein [Candidatus Marinarcus sp.]|uniref:ankyrin repeat domain-containing protein n=1 Tax=Candidatus Marinarcus sp. TaxID=3100987 RepID=UPI003B00FA52